MSEVVFFLEEPSAEAMLNGLLPRLLPASIRYRCIPFEGKQDLEGRMVRLMRSWRAPRTRFVILRDQDSADCRVIKARLIARCNEAGRGDAIVRIACRELESWYLADFAAVERGMALTGLQRLQNKSRYRDPDSVVNPSNELRRVVADYQKVGGSRAIGPHLDVDNGRSRSFACFISAVRRLVREMEV